MRLSHLTYFDRKLVLTMGSTSVNLAKGTVGHRTAKLLGSFLSFSISPLRDRRDPSAEHPDFNLYIDEFTTLRYRRF